MGEQRASYRHRELGRSKVAFEIKKDKPTLDGTWPVDLEQAAAEWTVTPVATAAKQTAKAAECRAEPQASPRRRWCEGMSLVFANAQPVP